MKKNRSNKSTEANSHYEKENQSSPQFTPRKRIRSWMEVAAYIAGALCVALTIFSATVAALGHKGLCLWTGCAAFCLVGVAGAFWLQDREWKKDVAASSPKDRPYVFVYENALTKPLTGGERMTIRVGFENTGPGEITLTLRNSTACFVVDDTRSLTYAPYDPAATITVAIPPKHRSEVILSFPGALTNEDINGLHDGRAKLYFFARGEYKDESGRTYPLDFRRKYDTEMPGKLVLCEDSITIGDE